MKPLQKKKIEEAQKDLDRLLQEVTPYIKKSIIVDFSTDGKWIDTTTLESHPKEENNTPSKEHLTYFSF